MRHPSFAPRSGPGRAGAWILGLTAVGLFLALAWNHDRLGGWGRALGLPLGLGVVLFAALVGRLVRERCRLSAKAADRPIEAEPLDSEALARAAEVQSARARAFIDQIRDVGRREALRGELDRIDAARGEPPVELNVVVFGTVSAGKTSLINALIGREVGETGPVMGTTRRGENHVYTVQDVDGAVRLTDTPGVSEAGAGGVDREREARALAVRADLLLFVVDHDLVRTEYAPLVELAGLGKRSIVVLNKKDRFPDADLAAIVARLRERLDGLVPREDVVAVAASPRPIPVRAMRPDGGFDAVLEIQEPMLQPLRDRIAAVLSDDGPLLRAANLLVKTRLLHDEAESDVGRERLERADGVVERYQWVTAGTVFANPVPALNLVAGAAVQLDMMAELAAVFGLNPSSSALRALAGRMVQAMLKVGLTEAAASVVAGLFKRTPVSFAAGGAVQAVTMAYLVRIAGKALIEYYRNGETWGEGGVEAAILRQFELNSRSEFLQDFARQGVDRFWRKVGLKAAEVAGWSGSRP